MLTNASRLTSRARAMPANRSSATRILGASGTAGLLKARHCHHHYQTRGFRFGMWSSYLDPEFHREVRRRHRMLKHKYAETLNRRLSWEEHPFSEDTRKAVKRMVSHYWSSNDRRPGGRFVNIDGLGHEETNPTGVRPGRNIEDAERAPLEHLLFGDKDAAGNIRGQGAWPHPIRSLRNYWTTKQHEIHEQLRNGSHYGPKPTAPQPSASASATHARAHDSVDPGNAGQDYIIDPITNRKVFKPSSPKSTRGRPSENDVEVSRQTFKNYRSQFSEFEPPSVASQQREPVVSDIRNVAPATKISRDPLSRDRTDRISANQDGSIHDPDFPASASDLQRYRQVQVDKVSEARDGSVLDPDFPASAADLRKYQQVPIDKNPTDTFHLRSSGDTPARTIPATPSDQTPVFESEDYVRQHGNSKAGYVSWKHKGVFWNGDVSASASDSSSSSAPQYPDLHEYKPVMHNEPDGKPLGYFEDDVPAELHRYRPVMHNEPDGKPQGYVEPAIDRANIRKFEALHEKVTDTTTQVVDEPFPTPGELNKYGPVMHDEPAWKPQVCEDEVSPQELRQYKPIMWNEPDGQPLAATESNDFSAELGKYDAIKYHEQDAKTPVDPNPVSDSLKEFDAKSTWTQPQSKELGNQPEEANEAADAVLKRLRRLSMNPTRDERAEDLDLLRASDIRSKAASPFTTKSDMPNSRQELEDSMARLREASDATDAEASSAVNKFKRNGRRMTGHYVKDFPEEFTKTWVTSAASLQPKNKPDAWGYSTNPQGLETAYKEELQASESTEGNTGDTQIKSSGIQPALDRLDIASGQPSQMDASKRAQAQLDPYSTEPQGLETSYADECGGKATWPTYVKTYNSPESKTELTESSAAADSTVYKILAYDPTMQTVNVAETTSIVEDHALPLTPAEVLLRLSNPAKFFPHFAPLQAQGFEIVSGSGDVLIFRKVRGPTEPSQGSATVDSDTSPAFSAVNPIDMMGAPYSASPTGYVNYDPGLESRPPPPARFRSGIDVRREEPVFSGTKDSAAASTTSAPTKKKSVGKRLVVGTVWVAGVSYALGVMGEYFKTGGADGTGPKGF